MRLASNVIEGMMMSKQFRDNTDQINALDFTEDGEFLISSSDDESLVLYNASSGKREKIIPSKKYGAYLVRFTHDKNAVVYASKNDWDESLRHLDFSKGAVYKQYFKGHRDRVVSLSMSPKSDFFLSSSLDNTIRLWDLKSPSCQGLLRKKVNPFVSFDPQGVIFAMATSVNVVKLYDLRTFDKGPFATFLLRHQPVEWTGIKFSPDGKLLLLPTTKNKIFLMDSFNGDLKQTFTGFPNSSNLHLEASFSPDGQYVLSGAEDGSIYVWETSTGKRVSIWKGHTGPVNAVQWNPKKVMVASGCTKMAFWVPPDGKTDFQPTFL